MSTEKIKKSPDMRLKGSDKLIKIRRPSRETRLRASLGAQVVKNLPVMQETWVRSLGWEDPLEKGMDTHSRILA